MVSCPSRQRRLNSSVATRRDLYPILMPALKGRPKLVSRYAAPSAGSKSRSTTDLATNMSYAPIRIAD